MSWLDRFRRTKQNAQPHYKTVNVPDEPVIADEELAAELPTSHNALAGMIVKWDDALLEIDPEAYLKMRRNLAIKKGHRKLAIRTGKLNWTVVGAKTAKKPAPSKPVPGTPTIDTSPLDSLMLDADPSLVAAITPDTPIQQSEEPEQAAASTQTRAEAIAEIFGQIPGWLDFIDHCTGSLYEGTRFQQIKTLKPDNPRNRSQGKWTVPDLYMGGRHRYNAGGDIEWDGAEQLVQVEKTTGEATRRARKLPMNQFAIHRPGPGSNPEGDLDLGVALFNTVVQPYERGNTSADLWMRLFAIPAVMMGAKADKTRPDRMTTLLENRAKQVAAALQSPGSTTALKNEEIVSLLQADPAGLQGMVAYLQYKESLVDDVLTLAALTSGSGLAQANRTGNTSEQKDNEDEAAFANGVLIAETFNRYILPWIIDRNKDTLPPLKPGEPEVYLWPNDPQEGDEQDVTTETEGTPGSDIDGDGLDMSPLDALGEAEDTENQAQVFEAMQARAATKRGIGGNAQVALAAVSPMPPVH